MCGPLLRRNSYMYTYRVAQHKQASRNRCKLRRPAARACARQILQEFLAKKEPPCSRAKTPSIVSELTGPPFSPVPVQNRNWDRDMPKTGEKKSDAKIIRRRLAFAFGAMQSLDDHPLRHSHSHQKNKKLPSQPPLINV